MVDGKLRHGFVRRFQFGVNLHSVLFNSEFHSFPVETPFEAGSI